jgi:hypothetical protein
MEREKGFLWLAKKETFTVKRNDFKFGACLRTFVLLRILMIVTRSMNHEFLLITKHHERHVLALKNIQHIRLMMHNNARVTLYNEK